MYVDLVLFLGVIQQIGDGDDLVNFRALPLHATEVLQKPLGDRSQALNADFVTKDPELGSGSHICRRSRI